jgi:diguanylate cyclase (GGDEF)-like protein
LRGLTGAFLALMFGFILVRAGLYSLPLPEQTVVPLTAVAFVVFAMAAPIACGIAAYVGPRAERKAWILLAAGAGIMVLGDAVSMATGARAALGAAPTTPLPALVWISSYLLFFVAALDFVEPVPALGFARWRRNADVVLVVLLVAAFAFAVVLFPVYGSNDAVSVVSALPTFVSLVLSMSLILIVLFSKPRIRFWHIPLFVALLSIGLGSLTELLMPINDSVAALRQALAPAVDMPWLVAYAMFTLAAFVRIRQRNVAPHLQHVNIKRTKPWVPVALMTTAFIAMPAFVYLGVSWRGESIGFWIFTGLAALLAFIAMGRNVILTVENASLTQHALVDPLTELYNHRFFQERLEREIDHSHREDAQVALLIIDIDDFDQVNNVYGHAVGDRRLVAIAERLAASARSTDVVCRVGGDEFAIIMPNTEPVEAFKVSMRLQDSLGDIEDGCPLRVGFSAGIAGVPQHALSREELSQRADGALYWAKLNGREQVIVFDEELVVSMGPEQRIERLEEESYVRMVQLLASAVDARDPYTQQHSRRVAAFAVKLGEALELAPDRIERIETAALLHDVGKIGVPDAVLRKGSRLTDAEYEMVKEHPALASRILRAIPRSEILPWITGHHEKWDGTGYPEGLLGEQIPLEARILAICDAYDAMTSERPYRGAMEAEEALQELLLGAGQQFDPELTAAFVRAVHESDYVDKLVSELTAVAPSAS